MEQLINSDLDGAAVFYDLKGLKCPLPVLKARKRMETLPPGARLQLETTDPLAGLDIPHFCHEDGHTLEETERLTNGHRFLIRKKS
ncbi:sulfurtransferase TusA family protein [Rhizobium sp. CFBP 8762]|uniref:sulfurtransferase TusA family protein n=1 Tax=Rhizobium sp. CFBP 8762 TaxID=2775279 RepID=UPI001782AAB8|nr:sulfurtransferase TusA family protein [Rhizobium sp. CFBP 8762]MBD8555587.1 sulfurtransferase TusA family protein [Rhizobium sp. CFBP 8762]